MIAIETSEIFKSAGLEIENIEFDHVQMESVTDISEGEVFYIVEDMPEFEGEGLKKFSNWVQQHVRYPDIALQNGISGTVHVQFVVDKTGNIASVKIIRSVDPSLDDEVLRVLKSAPNWTPGMQRGKKVNVRMNIPVKFKLQ